MAQSVELCIRAVEKARGKQLLVVARGGIEPPTFRFSGRGAVRSETSALVKLDELEPSWRFRACNTSGAGDAERMKTNL